jgi:hypothetical protein
MGEFSSTALLEVELPTSSVEIYRAAARAL